jgi:hypothetical protein
MSTEKKYQWILVAGNYEYDDNVHCRTEGFGDIVKVYNSAEKAGQEAMRRNAEWIRSIGAFSNYYSTGYRDDDREIIEPIREFAEKYKEVLAVHSDLETPGEYATRVDDWDNYVAKLVEVIDGDVMIEFIQSLPHFMYSVQQVEVED